MTALKFTTADREYLLSELRKNVLEVDFIKADGTLRTLKCTLKAEMLPPAPKKVIDTLATPKAENLEVIAAWDLENKGWRSFRLDSIQSVTVRSMVGLANFLPDVKKWPIEGEVL